jgi:hypothetical protein
MVGLTAQRVALLATCIVASFARLPAAEVPSKPTVQPSDAVDATAKRFNALFKGLEGTMVVRERLNSDTGEVTRFEFPLNIPFVQKQPGVWEERHLSKRTVTDREKRQRTETLDMITRLSADPDAPDHVLLAEIRVDVEGKEGEPFLCEAVPLGEAGVRTQLRAKELAKAKKGDWLSCDWTQDEKGKVKGVYQHKDSDKVVTWLEENRQPRTLDEGLAHLERILGRYSSDEQLEWQFRTEHEYKSRPIPSQPEVLMVFKGAKVVGHPFREPESISFDEVTHWERKVFDLAEGGEKKLTRTQRSHSVIRFSLSLKSGIWLVNGTAISCGVHDAIGKPAISGITKWHEDAFEFVGGSGVDEYYGAGGKMILGKHHGSTRYSRQDDRLIIRTRCQPYRLAAEADGTMLTIPDFKCPFGSVFEVEDKSDAREGN